MGNWQRGGITFSYGDQKTKNKAVIQQIAGLNNLYICVELRNGTQIENNDYWDWKNAEQWVEKTIRESE